MKPAPPSFKHLTREDCQAIRAGIFLFGRFGAFWMSAALLQFSLPLFAVAFDGLSALGSRCLYDLLPALSFTLKYWQLTLHFR